jgi:uracil-DNA glycosylase
MEDKREKLKSFFYKINDCRRCGLHEGRTRLVFGSGNAAADLMFVGEAPGKNEDLQGLPFVGRAGKILDDLLGSIDMDRKEVFIANVLKCRPPGNRDPKIDEINTCKEYLFEQIDIIDPKIICTLGKYSTQLILNTSHGITGLRGKVFHRDGRTILPINHPAAVLYTPSRIEILQKDFLRIKDLLDAGNTVESAPPDEEYGSEKDIKKDDSKQLGLF